MARTIGAPIPSDMAAALRGALSRAGEHAVLQAIGLSADTLARAAAGLRVHGGTRAAVELYLSRNGA